MEVRQTSTFSNWLKQLKDPRGRAQILSRIDRLRAGNPGDHRNLSEGIRELRLTTGPGYRVYYTQRGKTLVILLCGGDKSTQSKDIKEAKHIARQIQ
ncbi:Toxin RelE family protein [Salinisphaera shabanensis E1L3A]|uniref:Toxin RelE family protein n=1 Tax=Salinisphaera shabanensis E1L3A TaxID=1033802 RepID=F7QAM7_9GAMM|nr:type II toxin-antitoxin system RelE/ParE family toxin [Salinisphaera shabanensis]ERJ17418.1 Toxin RelE family protein [Salinisphaera shabanensis E1L3A]